MITSVLYTYQIRKDQDGFPHRETATGNTSNFPFKNGHQQGLEEAWLGTFEKR